MKPYSILILLFLVVGITFAQNLAKSGWSKNHASLHNSGVHTFANGLRSLDNAKLHQLDSTIYGTKRKGGIVFDREGTAYVGLDENLNDTRIIRILPDLTVEQLHNLTDVDYTSGIALSDDGKAIFIGTQEFTFYDFHTGSNYSTYFGPTDWYLFGPSATIVHGAFYLIDGDAKLRGYYMNGTSAGNFTGAFEDDNGARNEFSTPATTGNGIYYYCTGSVAITTIYAVRIPESQSVWKYNTSNPDLFGLDPTKQYLDMDPHQCDTSSVISPDEKVIYQMLSAGIIALDSQTGSLKWAKSFTSLANGVPLATNEDCLVSPVINPIDGSVIVLVINTTVSSRSNESYMWGLSQTDGSVLYHTPLSVPGNIQSAPAVTADGIFYFCTRTSCHGVDILSDSWSPLWEIPLEELYVYYSVLSISPDGSVWILDNDGHGTFYIGCESGYYIANNGSCSPCPANTVPFGTSCGFSCGNTTMLYHKNAACDCGADKHWNYASASCVDNPPPPSEEQEDSSAESIVITASLAYALISLVLI